MKLKEFLDVANENMAIEVSNTNCEFLAMYDGLNSIPSKYNDCEVTFISMAGHLDPPVFIVLIDTDGC